VRENFRRFRSFTPERRQELRQQWQRATPEQRQQMLQHSRERPQPAAQSFHPRRSR
jgi:hypothetical protein